MVDILSIETSQENIENVREYLRIWIAKISKVWRRLFNWKVVGSISQWLDFSCIIKNTF